MAINIEYCFKVLGILSHTINHLIVDSINKIDISANNESAKMERNGMIYMRVNPEYDVDESRTSVTAQWNSICI